MTDRRYCLRNDYTRAVQSPVQGPVYSRARCTARYRARCTARYLSPAPFSSFRFFFLSRTGWRSGGHPPGPLLPRGVCPFPLACLRAGAPWAPFPCGSLGLRLSSDSPNAPTPNTPTPNASGLANVRANVRAPPQRAAAAPRRRTSPLPLPCFFLCAFLSFIAFLSGG
jgi:hypothetical protein